MESRADYAYTLICAVEQGSFILPLGNGFLEHTIEERIGAIMKFKKITYLAAACALLLAGSMTLFFATSAESKAGEAPAQDTEAGSYRTEPYTPETLDVSFDGDLFEDYARFGISVGKKGQLYYHNKMVRYLWDGIEAVENAQSTKAVGDGDEAKQLRRYEYLNMDGKVDVHLIRNIKVENGRNEWEDQVSEIYRYSQKEFKERDLTEQLNSFRAAAVYEGSDQGTE